MSDLREISAMVRFLRPEEGGRDNPVFSGYRPAFYFGDKQTDGAIILVGTEKVSPGEEHLVSIKLLHPEKLKNTLQVGRVFEVKEGRKQVGLGRVTSVSSSSSIDEIKLIESNEELTAQKEKLPTQIVEYYDTYFSELRSQLQRPEIFSETIPDFLKGYRRVISIGGGDGLVVAHFPIELEITFSAKDGGNTLLRLPSILDAKEDYYKFLRYPELSVRDLVNLVSGEEDIGIEIPAEGVFWGVRGFNAPQQKVDTMTGELVWQAPWTRLVTADLYHLRFWENAERARQEAREDTEAYVRSSEPYAEETSTYEEPGEITVPEDLPDLRETPIFTGQLQQVGFGRNPELVSERNPVHERLRVPAKQYVDVA